MPDLSTPLNFQQAHQIHCLPIVMLQLVSLSFKSWGQMTFKAHLADLFTFLMSIAHRQDYPNFSICLEEMSVQKNIN